MNELLSNFVAAIKTLAQDADKNQPITVTKIDDTHSLTTLPDGTIQRFTPIEPRDHVLLSVAEIPEFVKYFVEKHVNAPVVWISDHAIVITLDDSDTSTRRDQAVYRPRLTDEFSRIHQINRTLTQAELIELLRLDLFGCLDQEPRESLLKLLRMVKWSDDLQSRKGTVVYEVESGGVSLTDDAGRSLAQFPDFITCTLPVFDDTALKSKFEVRLHLSVDPVKKNFHVRAVSADVHAAVQESLEQIRKLLADCDCPVFLGRPTDE